MTEHRNPSLATDIVVIRMTDNDIEVLLIKRKNAPFGWALPGGFVDYGESVETAAHRELAEETTLLADDLVDVGVWSDPDRDPRGHVVSVCYRAIGVSGIPTPKDDAVEVGYFKLYRLPELAFPDHEEMITSATWDLI